MLIPKVYAAPITNPAAVGGLSSLGAVVSALVPAIFGAGGLLTFSFLMLGGIKYVTAGGDDKAVQEAKKMLTNAIIGLAILVSAFWIMNILEAVFKYDFI